MYKKIALIFLFLGVTAGFAYLLYRFFFGAPRIVPPPTNGEVPTTAGGLPTAGTGKPPTGAIPGTTGLPTAPGVNVPGTAQADATAAAPTTLAEQAQSPFLGANGGLQYYDGADGKFYRLSANGTKQTLNAGSFPQAQEVIWSPDGGKAALIFPDTSKIIYDFSLQKQVTLPSHWEDVRFSADGSMIVAKSIGLDPASRWLISAASDGSSAKLIEPLGVNGDKVTVSVSPDASVVAFSDTADPVGFDTRDLLLIGQNHENFPALRVEGFDFKPAWSPSGNRLLYSAAGQVSGYKPMLWLAEGAGEGIGGRRRSLGVNTWADKCVFQNNDTAYCAVPRYLPDGAGLERAIADTIPDTIMKIDLASGNASTVGTPSQSTSIRSLVVSPDGARLWYVGLDGLLQELRLR